MPIPSRARLRAELHCLSHDGHEVRTAQHWVDPQAPADRPRSWLRLVINGRPAQDGGFFGVPGQAELENYWSSRVEAFAPTALTEDQMWGKLLELAGITRSACSAADGCPGVLPVGWWFCPECGRDARKVASGSMLWPRRRGVIVVDRRDPLSNP
jgi:hypothetical protein